MLAAPRTEAQTRTYFKSGFITVIMLSDETKNKREKIVLPHCP